MRRPIAWTEAARDGRTWRGSGGDGHAEPDRPIGRRVAVRNRLAVRAEALQVEFEGFLEVLPDLGDAVPLGEAPGQRRHACPVAAAVTIVLDDHRVGPHHVTSPID